MEESRQVKKYCKEKNVVVCELNNCLLEEEGRNNNSIKRKERRNPSVGIDD